MRRVLTLALAAATTLGVVAATAPAPQRPAAADRVVLPHGGQDAAEGDPVVLTDVYIEMDDGVRLAADIYLPPDTPTDGSVQVPCLVELTPYRKENRAAEGAALLPPNGFGLVEVDARGTGGSEGEYDIVFSVREQWDTARVIDWVAEDAPYCTEKVGMFGGSYSGIIQYLAASLDDEHGTKYLEAIAPQRAYGDLYRDIVYHGGQLITSFGATWAEGTQAYYTQPPTNVTTPDGAQAWVDHLTKNDPMLLPYMENPWSDGVYASDDTAAGYSQKLYTDSSVLPRIDRLTVPTLHLAGWFDSFTRGQLLTFQYALEQERAGNGGPHYLIVGPWNHGGTHFTFYEDTSRMLIEWYDHWLRGGPEPAWFGDQRVRWYQMRGSLDDDTGAWRSDTQWPPTTADWQRLYLDADGSLVAAAPEEEGSVDWFYDPTVGFTSWPSRWDNAAGVLPQNEGDESMDGDRSGATFVTEPFGSDVAIAGPIVARLNVATTGLGYDDRNAADAMPPLVQGVVPTYHDTDLVVKVSDVAPDGTATLITEGFLRASHRAIDESRSLYDDAGEMIMPFHPHTLATVDPAPNGEVRDYLVEVWPTAKTFEAGHRIRIDIFSADTPHHASLPRPALNTVTTGGDGASSLLLPFVPVGAPTLSDARGVA